MDIVSIYGSHDSSVCFFDGKQCRILELEKFTSKRNCSLSRHIDSIPKSTDEEFFAYTDYIKHTFGIDKIGLVIYNQLFQEDFTLLNNIFGVKEYSVFDHHLAHAASSFYQSPYEEALVVTFDGGGEGVDGVTSFFNFYLANRKGIKHIHRQWLNLGVAYERIAPPIKEIRKTANPLLFAGKLMGLCSYGKYNEKLLTPMEQYYRDLDHRHLLNAGVDKIYVIDGIEGQEAYDLAYMSQTMFQKLFEEAFSPIHKQYPHLPVCFSGGGALNVLNNQIWYERLDGKLFIPPNPNDCGLAFGGLVNLLKPQEPVDVTYAGFDIMDREKVCGQLVEPSFIAQKLAEGKIIGLIMGQSEVGPRALGNRSILCDPSIPTMKDILNAKVKFREWFRPFAPVLRRQDVSKYFMFDGESRFMNLCPRIREEYKNTFPAIIHKDNTSRIQTTTQEQHPFLYNLLSCLESSGKHPILLNTSFNIRGHSMINKVEDALMVLNTTELDAILIEGKWYIDKNNR